MKIKTCKIKTKIKEFRVDFEGLMRRPRNLKKTKIIINAKTTNTKNNTLTDHLIHKLSVRPRQSNHHLRTSFVATDHRNARRRYLHLHAGTLNAATLTNKTQCRTKKRKREKAQRTKMEVKNFS